MLSYQFVVGLQPDIKIKLAGVEGTFEQLLAKTRMEEAKLHDLAEYIVGPPPHNLTPTSATHTRSAGGEKGGDNSSEQSARRGPKCYYCQGQGHIVKNFPVRR